MNELELHDILINHHRTDRDFIWSRGVTSKRLDYIFVGENLLTSCTHSIIKTIGLTDHRAVIMEIDFCEEKRGPGIKINSTLFCDMKF